MFVPSAAADTGSYTLPTPWASLPANPAQASAIHIPGMRLTGNGALNTAQSTPRVARAVHGLRGVAVPDVESHLWLILYYGGSGLEAAARVDDATGHLLSFGVGGRASAAAASATFVALITRWWIFLPLCLAFFLPFFDPRRPLRALHIDLLALLAFGISLALLNRDHQWAAEIVDYALLGYLAIRAAYAGLRAPRSRGPLVPIVPVRWLTAGIVLFMALRIGLALASPSMLDVGGASVVGAHDLSHGISVYGGALYAQVPTGDTYGPFTYLAYAPFELIWPWHAGQAPPYPAGLAASLVFDLLVLGGLVLLGRRLRPGTAGRQLGIALGYAWATFPWAAFALSYVTNDALVAALLVFSLLAIASPLRRGALMGLASAAKLFPLALVPLLAGGVVRPTRRSWITFGIGFSIVAILCLAPFLPSTGLHQIYARTLGFEVSRGPGNPYYIWAKSPVLGVLRDCIIGATILFALALALRPAKRTVGQLAALGAAVIIAIQIPDGHWLHPYIVWFSPWLFVALFAEHATGKARSRHLVAPDRAAPLHELEVHSEPQTLAITH